MSVSVRSAVLMLASFFAFQISAHAECFYSQELAFGRSETIGSFDQGASQPTRIPLTKVARFYVRATGKHFWTIGPSEIGTDWCAGNSSFSFEGYGSTAGSFNVSNRAFAGGSPVFRFRNSQNGDYLYTISDEERIAVLANAPQYMYEGVAWFASMNQIGNAQPVHRFFSAANGAHFYTSNETERLNVLANFPSYESEGIAFWAW